MRLAPLMTAQRQKHMKPEQYCTIAVLTAHVL